MNDFEDRLRRHVQALTPEQVAPFPEVERRRDSRRRRRLAVAASGTAMIAVVVLAIGIQAAGSDRPHHSSGPATNSPSPSPTGMTRAEPTYELNKKPSPVVLRLAERDVELRPWAYCWAGTATTGTAKPFGGCADGWARTEDLDVVGGPASVDFWFGVEGWDFQATFTELGDDCPRQHTVSAVRTGDHQFRLDPAGPAGRYRVDLFGRGPHGDVGTSFRWTTPTGGPTNPPVAGMALIAGDRDAPETYGLSLGVRNLAFQPRLAEADVTVTAANGRSMVLDTQRDLPAPDAHVKAGACDAEGSVSFYGEDDEAQQAARLGPAPFTYEVRLTLDGKDYQGTAVWPRDEIADAEPNTSLDFDPPLPAYVVP